MDNEIKYLLYEMITSIEMVVKMEELFIEKNNTKVSFKDENEDFLIIDRDYLKENDLCKDLWYTLQEMNQFKQEAINDIQVFMMINPGICNKDAMKIMWSGLYIWE
jgi:predicted transcriptional regulator